VCASPCYFGEDVVTGSHPVGSGSALPRLFDRNFALLFPLVAATGEVLNSVTILDLAAVLGSMRG
jgi:hypothetical protein